MPDNKIVHLDAYKKKKKIEDKSDASFEKKILTLIHSPFEGSISENKLVSIFEEEQLKKDQDKKEE